MGGFVALIIFLLMLGGAKRFWDWVNIKTGMKRSPKAEKPTTKGKPNRVEIFIQALENEGYMSRMRLPDEELTYVDDPVLSDMLTTLGESCDLTWTLPEYRLRVRKMPEDAPDIVKRKYKWAVLTPSHVIGFNT